MKLKNANRSQYSVFFYLSACISILTLSLYFIDTSPFKRFIGSINPLLVILISFILGLVFLSYLTKNTSFAIYKKNNLKDYMIISGIALLFGIEVIVADIWVVNYSADINILFPKSLLFYPVISYIVEVFFHIIPISIFIFILSRFKKIKMNTVLSISIILVALLEPSYQIWFTSQNSIITIVYTAVHVFFFSLAQLLIFKHFDFFSMYMFRIIFYSIWHILWGYLRLDLIF